MALILPDLHIGVPAAPGNPPTAGDLSQSPAVGGFAGVVGAAISLNKKIDVQDRSYCLRGRWQRRCGDIRFWQRLCI